MKLRPGTLFMKMWLPLVYLLLASFFVNAFLVTATLQLGSEAQTERRLARIGDHWATELPRPEPVRIDPVTTFYPVYEMLPGEIRVLLQPTQRGIFELGPRSKDYFVLAKQASGQAPFYVVENHSEVKPEETLEWQVFSWYAMGIVPFTALLLWLCSRVALRVATPMQEIGTSIDRRSPNSLEPVKLPEGSPHELQMLVAQLNRSFQRTAEVLEREREFTRFASHELRTPVAIMQAVLERLGKDAPTQGRTLLRGERALRDMTALIETFLRLAREEPDAPSKAEMIDAAWIRELFGHLFGADAGGRIEIAEQAAWIATAPATVLQVLVGNMLKNAVLHGDGGQIHVLVGCAGLSVENAIGSASEGYGLGCLISQRICSHYGWKFELDLGASRARADVQARSLEAP